MRKMLNRWLYGGTKHVKLKYQRKITQITCSEVKLDPINPINYEAENIKSLNFNILERRITVFIYIVYILCQGCRKQDTLYKM